MTCIHIADAFTYFVDPEAKGLRLSLLHVTSQRPVTDMAQILWLYPVAQQ